MSLLKKISIYYFTLKRLKIIQVYYQFYYRLNKPKKLNAYKENKSFTKKNLLDFSFDWYTPNLCVYNNKVYEFAYLNQKVVFEEYVDWSYQKNGKLWNYNLQYASFLKESIAVSQKSELLLSLYQYIKKGKLPLEPYPVSLRCINVIRFLNDIKSSSEDGKLLQSLHAELNFLSKRFEYHLLGNHLLENAFALLMGGAFFNQKKWVEKSQKLLYKELKEQILPDGAHFELSPMYHQLMLYRVLELIDWYSTWSGKDKGFLSFLKEKATQMHSWLQEISFKDGSIPHFNDSADGIAPETIYLQEIVNKLDIKNQKLTLKESGYRSFQNELYEIKIDFAEVGASYQPGHAHADALNFLLNIKDKQFIVEQGTSTYEINERRFLERSTSAHNTVSIGGLNQSQVWSGFRVGKRASITIEEERPNYLKAYHDGYKKIVGNHTREFMFMDNSITITDYFEKDKQVEFHLHFAPGINAKIIGSEVKLENMSIRFSGFIAIEKEKYSLAKGYNRYKDAEKLIVSFKGKMTTEIKIGL